MPKWAANSGEENAYMVGQRPAKEEFLIEKMVVKIKLLLQYQRKVINKKGESENWRILRG